MLREGDVVTRLAHIHESPVLAEPVGVVHEDDEVVVVNKPASWPVHPCGNYRLNSLVYILGRDLGYRNLRPIHRLDKVSIVQEPKAETRFFLALTGARTFFILRLYSSFCVYY